MSKDFKPGDEVEYDPSFAGHGGKGCWRVLAVHREWIVITNGLNKPVTTVHTNLRHKQRTKPSINWAHVSLDYNWLARDASGRVFLYENMPIRSVSEWKSKGFNNKLTGAIGFASLVVGDCDWEDSLVGREYHENSSYKD
jgi:hypothetical protein